MTLLELLEILDIENVQHIEIIRPEDRPDKYKTLEPYYHIYEEELVDKIEIKPDGVYITVRYCIKGEEKQNPQN